MHNFLNIVHIGNPVFFPPLNTVFLRFYSLLSIEAKKSRSTGRQPKEPAPEETNKSVFVVFLKEAGVTLRQGGTSNEIGKHTQFQNIPGQKIKSVFPLIFLYLLFLYFFPSSCRPSSFSKKDTATTTEESQVPRGKYMQHPYRKIKAFSMRQP